MANKYNKKSLDAEITNTLMNDIGKFEYFFMTQWKLLVAIAIGLVLAIAIAFGIQQYQASAARTAANALSAAKTEAELAAALQKYGSSPSARFARLQLARMYMNSKKFDLAAQEFATLEKNGAPPEMLNRLKLDEAYLLENAGNADKAAASLEQSAHNAAFTVAMRAEAAYGAGRIQLQNLKNQAKAVELLTFAKNFQPQLDPANAEWSRLAEFLLNTLPAQPAKK